MSCLLRRTLLTITIITRITILTIINISISIIISIIIIINIDIIKLIRTNSVTRYRWRQVSRQAGFHRHVLQGIAGGRYRGGRQVSRQAS